MTTRRPKLFRCPHGLVRRHLAVGTARDALLYVPPTSLWRLELTRGHSQLAVLAVVVRNITGWDAVACLFPATSPNVFAALPEPWNAFRQRTIAPNAYPEVLVWVTHAPYGPMSFLEVFSCPTLLPDAPRTRRMVYAYANTIDTLASYRSPDGGIYVPA